MSEDWFDWPALPDLFPVSFPGVKTDRDGFLIDVDRRLLEERISDYFNPDVSHEEIARRYPAAMRNTTSVPRDARAVRDERLALGQPDEAGFIRCAYRPFDNRWLYWEADSGLLARPRPDYRPHVFAGNLWLSAARHLRKGSSEPQACVTEHVGQLHLIERSANLFPVWLRDDGIEDKSNHAQRANLSGAARRYLESLGVGVEDLFHHVLATLHEPSYRETNAGALKMEWPRIPLPGWPDGGGKGAAAALAESATRGRELAALLDPDTPVPGITATPLRSEIAAIAVPATMDGHNMTTDDFALTAGWGHYGAGDAVMPGQGRIVQRSYFLDERTALGAILPALGETTVDVYLNSRAYWRNVPAAVWAYKLGGYQVLKKWLSYRERPILERPALARGSPVLRRHRSTDRRDPHNCLHRNISHPHDHLPDDSQHETDRVHRDIRCQLSDRTAFTRRGCGSVSADHPRLVAQRTRQVRLVASELVFAEAGAGDPDAAKHRLEPLKAITLPEATEDAAELTQRLLDLEAVTHNAADDAAHIAIAVTNGVDYLVTWNFQHIANAAMRSRIDHVCLQLGYDPTAICTPNELMEPDHADSTH